MQKNIPFILLLSFASTICAQQDKQFTLDELIPGGKEFYKYYPRTAEQFYWQGDSLLQVNGDSVFYVEKPFSSRNKEFLFSRSADEERVNQLFDSESYNMPFTAFNKENNLFIKDKNGSEIAISDEKEKGKDRFR